MEGGGGCERRKEMVWFLEIFDFKELDFGKVG